MLGGKEVVSAGELVEGGCSLGGEPPEARARSAGGLYLAPTPCSASSSLALKETTLVREDEDRAIWKRRGWEGGRG